LLISIYIYFSSKVAYHDMADYIFLKSLRSLEEFRKNPHIKIPSKSPPTNFQSLGIFKNQIFIRKRIFPSLSPQSAQWPVGPSGLLAQPRPLFFFQPAAPPLPTGPRPLGPVGRASVAPCPIAASLAGKRLTSRRLHSSPCSADRWAPLVITFLRLRLSSVMPPPHLATSGHHSTPRDAAPMPLLPPPSIPPP
jgi:hypothetical protein